MESFVTHEFPAFFNEQSEILILGSFPSIKSREEKFFYMNKQNRFWKILASVYNQEFLNDNIEVKKRLLNKYHIALYDVIESCTIDKSSDASIKNVTPANLKQIIDLSKISEIYINGKTSEKYFNQYFKEYKKMSKVLSSTSSANASFSTEKLIEIWKVIKTSS